MSKSLGNFFTVREILGRYRPEEVRYFILTSHYRSPLNYDEEHLDNARSALTRFYTALRGLPPDAAPAGGEAFSERFQESMDDDFNTPEALAVLFDLVRELNRVREEDASKAAGLGAELRRLGGVLGLLQDDPEGFLKSDSVVYVKKAELGLTTGRPTESTGLSEGEIEDLIARRAEARRSKNWAEADRIRDELQQAGIVLEDGAQGTTWRRG
jgi:cysteinyl-tRNA synthetase